MLFLYTSTLCPWMVRMHLMWFIVYHLPLRLCLQWRRLEFKPELATLALVPYITAVSFYYWNCNLTGIATVWLCCGRILCETQWWLRRLVNAFQILFRLDRAILGLLIIYYYIIIVICPSPSLLTDHVQCSLIRLAKRKPQHKAVCSVQHFLSAFSH